MHPPTASQRTSEVHPIATSSTCFFQEIQDKGNRTGKEKSSTSTSSTSPLTSPTSGGWKGFAGSRRDPSR